MMDIDELKQRLMDETATFTSVEVLKLIEDTQRTALEDTYNKSRIAIATQHAQEGVTIARACAEQMLAQWSNDTTPELIEVTS